METIDIRSDTVSHPAPGMREAMAQATVGQYVYGQGPTVNALQEYAAELPGKEAALYCPSATQANVISLLTHCGRGDELIVGKQVRIYTHEAGAASVLGVIVMNQLQVQPDGTLHVDDITAAIRDASNVHFPLTRLICLENTQGGVGGVPITVDYTAQVGELAHSRGLKLHIDGARLFNAAAALKVQPRELVTDADSIQICLSKGLTAPLGALVIGSHEFIDKARRIRKMLGGGMRQAGIVAAAGVIAFRRVAVRQVHDTSNGPAACGRLGSN